MNIFSPSVYVETRTHEQKDYFFLIEPPTVSAVHCNLPRDQNTKYMLSFLSWLELRTSFVHIKVRFVILSFIMFIIVEYVMDIPALVSRDTRTK